MFESIKAIYEAYSAFTASNQFLGAAVATFVIGTLGYISKAVGGTLFEKLKSVFVTSIYIETSNRYTTNDERSIAFIAVSNFCGQKACSYFSSADYTALIQSAYDNIEKMWKYTLAIVATGGPNVFIHNKKLFWYKAGRAIEGEAVTSYIYIYTLKRNLECLTSTIDSVVTSAICKGGNNGANQLVIHQDDNVSYVDRRPIESVAIDKSVLNAILEAIDKFNGSKALYSKFGRTHKLNMMFTGEPGTGKTSLVKALASHYKCMIYIPSYATLAQENKLREFYTDVVPGSIVFIDDVDAIKGDMFADRDSEDKPVNSDIVATSSLSTFLSQLDGVATTEGVITILNTNKPELLDKALFRKGRMDHVFEIGKLPPEAISDYIEYITGKRINEHGIKPMKGCDLQAMLFENEDFDKFYQVFLEYQVK